VLENSAQELRPACDLRRVQSHPPPRRTLGRQGRNGAGKTTLLKMIAAPALQMREACGSAPACIWLLRATIPGRAQFRSHRQSNSCNKIFPKTVSGHCGTWRGHPILRRRRGQEDPRTLRRRKIAVAIARMLYNPPNSWCSTNRQIPGSCDQGDAGGRPEGFEGTMIFVSHDRMFPSRSRLTCAGTGR